MSIQEITKSKEPIVILKSSCAFKKMDNSILDDAEKVRKNIKQLRKSEHIKNMNTFAERLKTNTELSDNIVVYYLPLKEGEKANKAIDAFESDNIISLNFLRGETDHVLVITDEKLANDWKLEPQKYYAYFKPSYLNGFENLVDKDLNIEYLQAYEGICRDEFTPNFEFIQSEKFVEVIQKNELQFTQQLVDEHFDTAFQRTSNTQFIMNPNFESRYLASDADIPQCFVYVPDEYMRKYVHEIKSAIEDYQEVFEFVYTNDYGVASRYLYVDEFPDVMPFFLIVDKSKKLPIRRIEDPVIKKMSDIVVDSDQLKKGQDFYYAKYKEPIFLSNMEKEIQKFLEKYLEGKIDPYFQTQKMHQYTKVKEICQDTFEREIVYNRDVKQCIVEIFKHDCPSCMYNGKVFNAFSRKLDKHGVSDKLPCFRMSIENKVPYLGSFAYSPIYFFVKKDGDNITEVSILDIPVKYDGFISQLKEYTGLEKELSKIKVIPKKQVQYHFQLKDLDPGFEIDQDIKEQADEDAEEARKEKEEKDKPKDTDKTKDDKKDTNNK